MRGFILRELDRAGLGHNTFTQPAVDLIVRSADGVLRQARNLCVGCLIEAVRSASKTIDIDNVNRVLLQPHVFGYRLAPSKNRGQNGIRVAKPGFLQ
jgi:hypothetical protein